MIELQGVTRDYRDGQRVVHALRGIDLSVAAGETVALTGRSGSGKSTLLHVIGGLDTPGSGRVRVAGVALDGMDDAALTRFRLTRLGFVFQFFHLVPTCTVLENLTLPAELAGLGRRETERRARELAGAVGIGELLGAWPDRLSGGEQQRVAIARGLMLEPPLLLADEPTGNLDAETGGRVLELLFGLTASRGMTLVLGTHSAEAAALAGRHIELHDGRIRHDSGPAAESGAAERAGTGP